MRKAAPEDDHPWFRSKTRQLGSNQAQTQLQPCIDGLNASAQSSCSKLSRLSTRGQRARMAEVPSLCSMMNGMTVTSPRSDTMPTC